MLRYGEPSGDFETYDGNLEEMFDCIYISRRYQAKMLFWLFRVTVEITYCHGKYVKSCRLFVIYMFILYCSSDKFKGSAAEIFGGLKV